MHNVGMSTSTADMTATRRMFGTTATGGANDNTHLSTLRPGADKVDCGVWYWRHGDGATISVGVPSATPGGHALQVRDFTGPTAEVAAENYAGHLRASA